VNEWPGGEPAVADVQREFPGWHCWRGTSSLFHARRRDSERSTPAQATGEDPRDLRDQIIRAEANRDQ
jgi:hypothetical protein